MMGLIAAFALDLVVLAVLARVTPARALTVFLALLVLTLGVGQINLLVEAIAFGVLTPLQALQGFAVQAVIFIALSALAAWGTAPGKPLGLGIALQLTPLRILGIIVAYITIYMAAGMITYPFVQDFYAGHTIPPISLLLGIQVLRALLFALSAAPLLRLGPAQAPLVIGLAFSVLGGIAPLIPDNPFMPLEVRMPHLIEVGISNFVFGVVLAWLLTARKALKSAAPV